MESGTQCSESCASSAALPVQIFLLLCKPDVEKQLLNLIYSSQCAVGAKPFYSAPLKIASSVVSASGLSFLCLLQALLQVSVLTFPRGVMWPNPYCFIILLDAILLCFVFPLWFRQSFHFPLSSSGKVVIIAFDFSNVCNRGKAKTTSQQY